MSDLVRVQRGRYHDSVTLLRASAAARAVEGVETAIAAMGTELNLGLLADAGFVLDPDTTADDLVVAVRAPLHTAADDAVAAVEQVLAERPRLGDGAAVAGVPPHTVEAALDRAPEAAIVVVSVPGEHADVEARAAIGAGRHVMVFSDGVGLDAEVALKRAAGEAGVLLMGPDCGTVILDGVGLGFANAVAPGPVGIVAASGTGAQQLCALLDGAGIGVRHVLGVGGRDLAAGVDGMSTLAALATLDADPAVEVIALVSKPPDPTVAGLVAAAAAACDTPVVPALLGPGRPTLTDAAAQVAEALGRDLPEPRSWAPPAPAARPAARTGPLLGLFSGGTNAAEALVVLTEVLGPVRSNIHPDPALRIGPDDDPAGAHVVLDLGDDELTAGRPHPMLAPELVAERLAAATAAPTEGPGAVLLDVVLGHGAHPDPAAVLAPAIAGAAASGIAIVVTLVGTERDAQGVERQAETLARAGATVHRSNAAAARQAITEVGGATTAPGLGPSPGPVDLGPAANDVRSTPVAGLLAAPEAVVTVGAPTLDEAIAAQGVRTIPVDWRPPPAGSVAAVRTASRAAVDRDAANHTAVGRMAAVRPRLVDVVPAATVVGLGHHQLLHAGPPITWDDASGPLRGAIVGACLYEGWADAPEAAEKLAATGAIELAPCHDHAAVGPMAGVVSPSMPMWVLDDAAGRGTSRSTLNEGLGKVLRYGAFGPPVIERLHWMQRVLGPVLASALHRHGPVDVAGLIASMLTMGDEGHNRNRAGTALLVRALAPELVRGVDADERSADEVAEVFAFMGGNDHFLLNVVMAAGKLVGDAGAGVAGSTVVTTMARNGTEFGIRVAGTGGRWFTGPAAVPDGLYLGGFGPGDANPDIGDSAVTETVGLGGFAMAGAPAIVQLVGGEVDDARRATELMYQITLTEHPLWALPLLGFRGVPFGIDVLRVVRTGVVPIINTGMAGRVAGTGQVGAGLVRPPLDCFTAALAAVAHDTAHQTEHP